MSIFGKSKSRQNRERGRAMISGWRAQLEKMREEDEKLFERSTKMHRVAGNIQMSNEQLNFALLALMDDGVDTYPLLAEAVRDEIELRGLESVVNCSRYVYLDFYGARDPDEVEAFLREEY